MLPEQWKLIAENQKLLYSFRKNGTDLPKKEIIILAKTIGISFPTLQKNFCELQKNNIILDYKNFIINPNFAYFLGFYATDNEIEVELLDFSLESALEKIVPGYTRTFKYESECEFTKIIGNVINDISKNVNVEAVAVIFNKFMNYQEDAAYYEEEAQLKLYGLSVRLKNDRISVPHKPFIGDTVLAYTLYLREKVFDSKSIVYYDLDQNSVCYVIDNILPKNSNPVGGMIFPRFSDKQRALFKKLEKVPEDTYLDIIKSNIDEFKFIKPTCLQLKSLFNPEHFVLGGKMVKRQLINMVHESIILEDRDGITSKLLVESPSTLTFDFIKHKDQPSKGAGIFAAYSFFNWDLKW